MLHQGFNKRENWLKNGYQYAQASQTEMIKRAYPEYNPEEDWVLWIIPDLFHNREFMKLVGVIEVKKKDGSVLEFPYVVRTPYYNKRLQQISLVPGDKRKRIFGVPLIFHSFEELEEISEVHIKWNVYEKRSLDTLADCDLHFVSVQVHYKVSFLKNTDHPEFRVFTIHSKDYSSTIEKKKTEYYNEFDLAIAADSFIRIFGDEFETVTSEIYDNHAVSEDEKTELSDDIIQVLVSLSDEEKKIVKELSKQMVIKNEVQYYPDYLEKEEVLTAEFMADLITEPGFGFKEV